MIWWPMLYGRVVYDASMLGRFHVIVISWGVYFGFALVNSQCRRRRSVGGCEVSWARDKSRVI